MTGAETKATQEDIKHVSMGSGVVHTVNHSHDDPEDHAYTVQLDDDGNPVYCECPAFEHYEGDCKHMVSVSRDPVVIHEALDHHLWEEDVEGAKIIWLASGEHGQTQTPIALEKVESLRGVRERFKQIGIDPEYIFELTVIDRWRI